MLILSRVCVEFRTPRGVPLFEITPLTVNTFQEAPEAIKEDPIFSLLIADGSLEAVIPAKRKKELENDPIQDTDASGKKKTAAPSQESKTAAPTSLPPKDPPEPEKKRDEPPFPIPEKKARK